MWRTLANSKLKRTILLMNEELIEGVDYILDKNGMMILTKAYLLKRGRCCQSGCTNCPYGYSEKVDPNIPAELNIQSDNPDLSLTKNSSSEIPEIYDGEIPEEFL